jgi:hypothetical protein
MRLEGSRRPHGSPGDANGSRECAPDDRLRVVHRHSALTAMPLAGFQIHMSCVDVYGPRPIATDRLSWFRRSQLLTYIRLFEAAGQRLRREPRWVFARFHLNGPKTSAEAVPVHTSGLGSDGVTVSPSPAFLLQLLRWDLLLLYGPQATIIDSRGS